MKIGKVARQVDVSPSTIRYYEGAGLLPRASRDCHGYRDYDEADVERIKLVTGARRLGVSLADIKYIVAIHDDGEVPSPRILELIRQKALDVDERRSRLESSKEELCRLREAALELSERKIAGGGTAHDRLSIRLDSTTTAQF